MFNESLSQVAVTGNRERFYRAACAPWFPLRSHVQRIIICNKKKKKIIFIFLMFCFIYFGAHVTVLQPPENASRAALMRATFVCVTAKM